MGAARRTVLVEAAPSLPSPVGGGGKKSGHTQPKISDVIVLNQP